PESLADEDAGRLGLTVGEVVLHVAEVADDLADPRAVADLPLRASVAPKIGQRDRPTAHGERARDLEIATAVLPRVVHDRDGAAGLAVRRELEDVQEHEP